MENGRLISSATVIGHDGFLSRQDIYFGDDHAFNATIWDSVTAWFTNSTISLSTAITARAAHLVAATAVNPVFDMSASAVEFSGIETALYTTVSSTQRQSPRQEGGGSACCLVSENR
jgi:hypothetical protein